MTGPFPMTVTFIAGCGGQLSCHDFTGKNRVDGLEKKRARAWSRKWHGGRGMWRRSLGGGRSRTWLGRDLKLLEQGPERILISIECTSLVNNLCASLGCRVDSISVPLLASINKQQGAIPIQLLYYNYINETFQNKTDRGRGSQPEYGYLAICRSLLCFLHSHHLPPV